MFGDGGGGKETAPVPEPQQRCVARVLLLERHIEKLLIAYADSDMMRFSKAITQLRQDMEVL
jgi:hypothetical protein